MFVKLHEGTRGTIATVCGYAANIKNLKELDSGKAVVEFSVKVGAVDEYVSKALGGQQIPTDKNGDVWVVCSLWDNQGYKNLAHRFDNYMRRADGSPMVVVTGLLSVKESNNGFRSLALSADGLHIVGTGKSGGQRSGQQSGQQGRAQSNQSAPAQRQQTQNQQAALDNEEITLPGTQLTINDYMTERERAQAQAPAQQRQPAPAQQAAAPQSDFDDLFLELESLDEDIPF